MAAFAVRYILRRCVVVVVDYGCARPAEGSVAGLVHGIPFWQL